MDTASGMGGESGWRLGPRFTVRRALAAGYAAVIALLVFSSFEANHVQSSSSEEHVGIYRRYVRHDEAATNIRKTMWLAGGYVRDFFIQPSAEGAERLRTQLRNLKADSFESLAVLEKGDPPEAPRNSVRPTVEEFWASVEPVPDTMLNSSVEERQEYVLREMVPRRSTLYATIRELTQADQRALQMSEAQFSSSRRTAARRLLAILGVSVVLAFLVAGFSLVYAGSLERETQRQYVEVEQAKQELEALSARLVEAEEEWRRRLSRELHDEIGQSLALLQIELSNTGNTAGDGQRLARGREIVKRLVQTVRDITLLLRPALLDDLGLVPALEWLTEDFTRRSGIPCKFREQGIPEELPDATNTCVYRIVQESLHNAEKHSGATRAGVSIGIQDGKIVVEVEDNGRGFEHDAKGMPKSNAGMGILGMRERAARLGGTLTVGAVAGGGTRVRLVVPVAVAGPPDRTQATAEGVIT